MQLKNNLTDFTDCMTEHFNSFYVPVKLFFVLKPMFCRYTNHSYKNISLINNFFFQLNSSANSAFNMHGSVHSCDFRPSLDLYQQRQTWRTYGEIFFLLTTFGGHGQMLHCFSHYPLPLSDLDRRSDLFIYLFSVLSEDRSI